MGGITLRWTEDIGLENDYSGTGNIRTNTWMSGWMVLICWARISAFVKSHPFVSHKQVIVSQVHC